MRPLEVFTSASWRDGQAGCGIVIAALGRPSLVLGRLVRARSPAESAYRALVHGLWRARATGARRILAHTDCYEVVEQLAGKAEVPPELIGLYLQVRALLNAYRRGAVDHVPRERNVEAARAALEALERGGLVMTADLDEADDLQLFSPTLVP